MSRVVVAAGKLSSNAARGRGSVAWGFAGGLIGFIFIISKLIYTQHTPSFHGAHRHSGETTDDGDQDLGSG